MNEELNKPPSGESRFALTGRQQEVLLLVDKGLTSMEIGDILHIKESTVERHRDEVFKKVKRATGKNQLNVAGALSFCREKGLLPNAGQNGNNPASSKVELRKLVDEVYQMQGQLVEINRALAAQIAQTS
jgi:hypothetical protein